MAANTPPAPAPQRPRPRRAPVYIHSRKLAAVLLVLGVGLVALGLFRQLQAPPDGSGPWWKVIGLGLIVFALALVLASPTATRGLSQAATWIAALVRQHPWRIVLVLLSFYLTWALVDSLRSLGPEHGWSHFPLWIIACASYLLAFLPQRWSTDRLGSLHRSGEQAGAWLRRHRWEAIGLGRPRTTRHGLAVCELG